MNGNGKAKTLKFSTWGPVSKQGRDGTVHRGNEKY